MIELYLLVAWISDVAGVNDGIEIGDMVGIGTVEFIRIARTAELVNLEVVTVRQICPVVFSVEERIGKDGFVNNSISNCGSLES